MHHHEHEDEMFLVLEGTIQIKLSDRTVDLHAGEFVIIPKGTPHQPMAVEEAKVLMFEPESTLNTGNLVNEFTRRNIEVI